MPRRMACRTIQFGPNHTRFVRGIPLKAAFASKFGGLRDQICTAQGPKVDCGCKSTFDGRFLVHRVISPVCGHLTFTYLKACRGVVGMEGSGSQMFRKKRALLAKVKRSSIVNRSAKVKNGLQESAEVRSSSTVNRV